MPVRETNLIVGSRFRRDAADVDLGLAYGLSDHWEISAQTGTDLGEGALRWRMGEQSQFPLDIGALALGRYSLTGGRELLAGPVAGFQWKEQEFTLNLLAGTRDAGGGFTGLAAWRSPYWLESVRLGLEGVLQNTSSGQDLGLIPQASLDLPGDLSLNAGVQVGPVSWKALLRLSYLLFPNP
jgi:hypothetical protein